MKTFFTAAAAALVLTVATAQAKPMDVCLLTGGGKYFLSAQKSTGVLEAKATSCAGDAIFEIEDIARQANVQPRFDKPVLVKASNGKYVEYKGLRLHATTNKVKATNTRFQFYIRPFDQKQAKLGSEIKAGLKVHMFPVVTKYEMVTMALSGGGGVIFNRKRPPKAMLKGSRKYYFTAVAVPNVSVEKLKQTISQLRKSIAANNAEIKKRNDEIKARPATVKKLTADLKKAEAALKVASK